MSGPVVLVVADRTDVGGRAALGHRAARPASSAPAPHPADPHPAVLVVAPGDLARAGWVHRVDAAGRASTVLVLPGHEPLRQEDVAAVWYRAREPLQPPAAAGADPRDRWYAVAELTALVTSWLLALGPRAVNRPSGADPTGPAWPVRLWADLARRHGLGALPPSGRAPVPRADARPAPGGPAPRHEDPRRLTVLGRRVVGALDEDEAAAAAAVAAEGGCRALGLTLVGGRLIAATTVPLLQGPADLRAARTLLAEVAA